MDETARRFYLAQMGISLWQLKGLQSDIPQLQGEALVDSFDEPWPFGKANASRPVASRIQSRKPSGSDSAKRANRMADLKSILSSEQAASSSNTGSDAPNSVHVATDPVSAPQESKVRESSDSRAAPPSVTPPAEIDPRLVPDLPELDFAWWSGSRFRIVSRWSANASDALQSSLATNILKALGDEFREHTRVVWPVFTNPGVLRNLTMVRDNLQELARPQSGLREIWLGCAADLESLVGGAPDNAVVFESTIAELCADGAIKRALWQSLRHEGCV